MRTLRFTLGVTKEDKIKNEYIRRTAGIEQIGKKVRKLRLRWYRHMFWRDEEYVGKKVMGLKQRLIGGPRDGLWVWWIREHWG